MITRLGSTRRRAIGLVAAAASLAIVATGCTLLLLPGDLSGGPEPDASTDAPPAREDGSTKTSADAGENGPWDASAGPFCNTRNPRPMFCIDFDDSKSINDQANFHSVNGFTTGGVTELDKTTYTSPSTSLHLGVPAGVPGTQNGLTNRIGYKFAVSPTTSTHFECDLRVDATDATGNSNLVWLSFNAAKEASLGLYVSKKETGIAQTPSYSTRVVAASLPIGKWAHFDLDFAFTPSSATLTVKLDGVVALDRFALDAVFAGGGGGSLSLGPAYYTSKSVEATEAHFDNVIIEHR